MNAGRKLALLITALLVLPMIAVPTLGRMFPANAWPAVLVIALAMGGSLLIVRDRVRRQAAENLSADLTHALATFQNIQRQRREELLHENALLADLPSLKALMTRICEYDQPSGCGAGYFFGRRACDEQSASATRSTGCRRTGPRRCGS